MDTITKIETGIKPLARIAAVAGVFAGIGVLISFYMGSIYHPGITITSVDYKLGIADFEYKDYIGRHKTKRVYSGSKVSAGGPWSVQFGGPTFGVYDRVELVKNDITYQVLNLSAETFGSADANKS